MAQVITLAGERLFALKAQNNQQLDIDTFIFAYVPGQDSTVDIDRNEGLPPVGQRVHTQIVQQYGMLGENAVVYSSVLDSLTGPFQFNWVGLYSAVNQTLIAIQHIPTVSKTITEPGASGNILNRNFVIEYSGIAELTGITVDPTTWQYDFEARLNGMDELTRQLAADMNGKDWFIGDGFKVVPRSTLNTFKVTAGVGYVSGLRVELTADHILTLSSYPQFVYVDAWFEATSESIWKGKVAFTVTNTEMDDYIDVNGRNHYVFKLASIASASDVSDLRNVDGLPQQIKKFENSMALLAIENDVAFGIAMSNEAYSERLAYRSEAIATGKISKLIDPYITKNSEIITVGTHLGGDEWREVKLVNSGDIVSGTKTPWKCGSERIFKALGWQTIKDAAEYVASETNAERLGWAVYSSGGVEYVGHQNGQLIAADKTLTFTFSGKGDFDLCFTGRTGGGVVEVSVNGGAPFDVDTYTDTDLKYRQFVQFAQNMPEGTYTVIVKSTSRKNASSSGTQANISGIRIRNGNVSPISDLFQPKEWRAEASLRAYDEVRAPNGNYYNRSSAGVIPATPPTHLTGTVDGWAIQAGTSFSQREQKISSGGSEREYKYDARPVGNSDYQDVGGNLHGNEYLNNISTVIDGIEIELIEGQYYSGKLIEIRQDITDFYGEFSSKIELCDVLQRHQFDNVSLKISSEFAVLTDFQEKVSYYGMWPFLSYNAESPTKNFAIAATPRSSLNIKDFQGTISASPILNKRDFYIEALGRAFVMPGVRGSGIPTPDNGEKGLRIALKVKPGDFNKFSDSQLFSGVAPNISGGNFGGFTSLVSKMYVQNVGNTAKLRTAGERYSFSSEYILELYENNLDISVL
nr:phage tail protein [uncultured Shewanella sp.]